MHKGWIGIVADFQVRNGGVLINLSDEGGVRFRWIHRNSLMVLPEACNQQVLKLPLSRLKWMSELEFLSLCGKFGDEDDQDGQGELGPSAT
jgi:hypothetical protein